MDFARPPKWKRVLKRAALGFAWVLAVAVAGAFALQIWRDARLPPPKGAFVTIDGRKIHYRVSGAGHYTFVLEAGLGDYSDSWGNLETSFAGISRTFVYDRAGLGWSDAARGQRSAGAVVDDLHSTLEAAAIPKPYILVGHSFGGLTQTLFAQRYRSEVEGLLLIDPSHKDQMKVLPAPPAWAAFVMKQLSRAAPIGLPQALIPSHDRVALQSKHVQTAGAELRAMIEGGDPWSGAPISLGSTPIYIMTSSALWPIHGKSDAERKAVRRAWYDLHAHLLAASTSSIRRHDMIADTPHYIQRARPDLIVGAARELIGRIGSASEVAKRRDEERGSVGLSPAPAER